MKFSAFFVALFAILLVASSGHAREGLKEYWNIVTKDQPMPETVTNLIVEAGFDEKQIDSICLARGYKKFKTQFADGEPALPFHYNFTY